MGFAGNGVGNYSKHYNPFAYSEQVGEGAIARAHLGDFRAPTASLRGSCRASCMRSGQTESCSSPGTRRRASRWPAGGRVALIATGPGARRHVRTDGPADHYPLLATLEGGLGLARLGHAATASVSPLVSLLERH